MNWEIDSLSRQINTHREKPDINPEVELYVQDQLTGILGDIEKVRGKNGYEHFIIDFVQEQAYKNLDSTDGTPKEPMDSMGLCKCSNSECPLKNGQLPHEIRSADSLDAGMIEFAQDHARPVVLEQAKEEWRDTKRRVQEVMSNCLVALKRNEVAVVDSEWDSPFDQSDDAIAD